MGEDDHELFTGEVMVKSGMLVSTVNDVIASPTLPEESVQDMVREWVPSVVVKESPVVAVALAALSKEYSQEEPSVVVKEYVTVVEAIVPVGWVMLTVGGVVSADSTVNETVLTVS